MGECFAILFICVIFLHSFRTRNISPVDAVVAANRSEETDNSHNQVSRHVTGIPNVLLSYLCNMDVIAGLILMLTQFWVLFMVAIAWERNTGGYIVRVWQRLIVLMLMTYSSSKSISCCEHDKKWWQDKCRSLCQLFRSESFLLLPAHILRNDFGSVVKIYCGKRPYNIVRGIKID